MPGTTRLSPRTQPAPSGCADSNQATETCRFGVLDHTAYVNHINNINEINLLIDKFNNKKWVQQCPRVPVERLQSRGQHQKRRGSGD